jgi:vacuolar protein 8
MAEIAQHVRALREGDDAAKYQAARALVGLACYGGANKVAVAVAGGIPPLVELLRDGGADAKVEAALALGYLAYKNNANRVRIAEAGGIPPLVDLLRDGSAEAKTLAAWALRNLASDNADNQVLIAVGFEAFVQLARRGSVAFQGRSLVSNAALLAKRKAALVVAALLRDSVPGFKSAPHDIKAVIGAYL